VTALGALQRYARAGARAGVRPADVCELCAVGLPDAHAHLVDLQQRRLCCACKACSLLFVEPGAAGGRYRTVPSRVLADPGFVLNEAQWAALEIPVRLAFFFFNSSLGRWVALYPGPAGVTESELPLEGWTGLAAGSALVASVQPDVEALLVDGRRGVTGFECLLVPIDACYELAARLRGAWKGFDGGDETRQALEVFFEGLRARCRPLPSRSSSGGPP
jgi:Family of unknown function (DUF5947)